MEPESSLPCSQANNAQISYGGHDIKVANKSIENVAQFKHLGTTVKNQN
jgi:hypothetical protein